MPENSAVGIGEAIGEAVISVEETSVGETFSPAPLGDTQPPR
jgi:hypothetical protein